jgi:hypothetical protein
MASQSQQSLLLRVGKRYRLEAFEYDGVVCDDDGRVEGYGFVGDSFGQVDGEEDRIRLTP